jgi:membrane dipeptidase
MCPRASRARASRAAAIGSLAVVLAMGCSKPSEPKRNEPSSPTPDPAAPSAAERARELAHRLIIVDGHVDLPYRLEMSSANGRVTEDVSKRTAAGDFDLERARAGGLDAPFMSIYVSAAYQASGGARKQADQLIDGVEQLIGAHPADFAPARSPSDVRQNSALGKISLPLGIENGAALERDLGAVRHFRERGVSYVTLTHTKDNAIGDSSGEDRRTHGGLSAFGKQIIAEMNRAGILIDVSHISDQTFADVLVESRVPVIASHSSVRHFVPGFLRNMSDEMIEALAQKGGVLMLNFGSAFLRPESNAASQRQMREAAAFAEHHQLNRLNKEHEKRIDAHAEATVPMVFARVEDVADQIDYVKKLVGIEHIGLGSDFEGVGNSLPVGLKDVSEYPNLLRVLLERGYTESELEQLCSGNVFRVWQAALDYAEASRKANRQGAKDVER